jgi:colanic acid biosynthesis glycosyl transferase WcaI
MKIGFLTQYYPPEVGAPQARLSELAQRFLQRGHKVIILTAMPSYPRGKIYPGYGGLLSQETEGGSTITRTYIYPTKSVKIHRRLLNYLSFVLSSSFFGTIMLPSLDYLLTESPPLFLGLSGYWLSRLKKARLIFNVSDLWPESAVHLGAVQEGLSLDTAYKIEAFCYRKAWLVTGQSQEILRNIQGRFSNLHTFHLSNGVDPTRFDPNARSDRLRKWLGINEGCVAVYAGLHGIAQGLEQVLAAAKQLKDLPLHIVLIGDGPKKEVLIKQTEKMELTNVYFHNSVTREEIPSILKAADIALVPLKQLLPGAVPSKIYEAMAAGLPIVLAAEGEAAHIVKEAKAGIVVPPGDAQAIASALRELVQAPHKRTEMGKAGRLAALNHFNRELIADTFIDYLEARL